MASSSDAASLNWRRGAVLGVVLTLWHSSVPAQQRISLADLGKRNTSDSSSPYVGKKVAVHGLVNAPAYHFPQYSMLAIQEDGYGAVLRLRLPEDLLDGLHPGEEIQVQGTVGIQFGMPVVEPESIIVLGRKTPPAPIDVSPKDLQSFTHLGKLVRVEGLVQGTGSNAGGAVVLLSASKESYRIFIPQIPGHPMANLQAVREGDTVRATGVALQYCPQPPYNSGWELLVADATDIAAIQRSGTMATPVIAASVGLLLIVAIFLYTRERRLRSQRKKLRKTYQLGEEILGASSTVTILKRISESLPGILGVTRVQLYIYNRTGKTLDLVVDERGEPASISLSQPPGGTPAGAVACFHYRTLLVIPDIDRSPFPIAGSAGERVPKSLLFVPMMAQSEVVGVLELDQDDRVRDFGADVQSLAQHLGNQIGVAIRLLDQRSVQEQLFRTEKMAAVGRLISGVVNELQTPLAHIKELAHKAAEKAHGGPAEREVSAIAAEAAKASGMVSRLVSYAANEQVEAKSVDVTLLLANLIEFREGDWKASGIRVRNLISHEPMFVLGSQGQLEQVFLNLFVHAEQSLADSEQKAISIRTALLAKRVLVEISFTSPIALRKPEEMAGILGVTRSVVGGHGGEVRLIEKPNTEPRFEVELPATARDRSATASAPSLSARDSSRRRTALVIEHEDGVQRQILALLSARGYRVVPVSNTDTGLDMSQRMRFDVVFCSLRAPGLNWVELAERMHTRVGGFVLISEGYDAELTSDFEGDGRYVLPKPVQEDELDRILRLAEPRGATIIPFKTGTA